MDLRCIQCGFRVNKLYVQYSPGNIRLRKCEQCKAVADEYIECEIMILLIDLILHKPKAYRHLLYNTFDRASINFELELKLKAPSPNFSPIAGLGLESDSQYISKQSQKLLLASRISLPKSFSQNFPTGLWLRAQESWNLQYRNDDFPSCIVTYVGLPSKSMHSLAVCSGNQLVVIFFWMLRALVLLRSQQECSLSTSFPSLFWRYGKILMDVFLGNLMFLCILLLTKGVLLGPSCGVSRFKDLMIAILISSYFKIFLVAMMVWEFPISVIFIIDLFVLSSNTVALKVITKTDMSRCVGVCFSAHALKIFVNQVLSSVFICPGSLR